MTLTTCKFFVERKKRFCKMLAKELQEFCPEHSISNNNETKKRIPCPIDRKHTVFEHKLESHLKICNGNKYKKMPYYTQDINSDILSDSDIVHSERLCDISDEEVRNTIEFISKLKDTVLAKYGDLVYDLNAEPHTEEEFAVRSDKHRFQYVRLIEEMRQRNLLQLQESQEDSDEKAVLEFGAGKGGFCHFLLEYADLSEQQRQRLLFVLIDRQGVRNRFDARHKGGPTFERILMDISHLNLARIECLENRKLTAVSKHLCGVATDLTLRCLYNWISSSKDASDKFEGLVIALCCHHKCRWSSYVNRDWLLQLGIGPRQFHLMTLLSSWATCGEVPKFRDILIGGCLENTLVTPAEIGLLCKRIIDLGRKVYIEKNFGLRNVHIKSYISSTVTLENCVLLAHN